VGYLNHCNFSSFDDFLLILPALSRLGNGTFLIISRSDRTYFNHRRIQ